jgi:hypothetical protein
MQRFEYETRSLFYDRAEMNKIQSEYAAGGWRLHTAFTQPMSVIVMIFERPVVLVADSES